MCFVLFKMTPKHSASRVHPVGVAAGGCEAVFSLADGSAEAGACRSRGSALPKSAFPERLHSMTVDSKKQLHLIVTICWHN